MEKERREEKNHSVTIENRRRITLTGVTDTDKFSENSVLLYTCMGEVLIKGADLHVTALSVENGEMSVEGEIGALIYGDSQVKSPLGFMGKLLK